MRSIKQWRFVLIIAVVVIAIPIAASVGTTASTIVEKRSADLSQQIRTDVVEETPVAKSASTKSTVRRGVTLPQDYYDRRRQYWEDRMERRADHLEPEDGDDDAADSDDGKDNEDSAGSDDDEGDSMDDEEEMLEKRREYWRDRLDRDW
ncbi:MAG: hypothetical protein DMF63_02630 [Acidobacteria bacterium]|nr:MAG: hypothetical protein DMF63_02630 [Acidobacteriota bacterium]